MSSQKPRNPDLTPEMLAYIESDDPGCGKEFVPGLCRTRHLAAKVREARGLEHGPCAYCLHFVTKSADKPAPEAERPLCKTCGDHRAKDGFEYCSTCLKHPGKLKFARPEQPQEESEQMKPEPTPAPKKMKPAKPALTCSICGNPRGKNPSGLCRPCSARRNAENARAAKPKKSAPKTGAVTLTTDQLKALKSDLPTPEEAAAIIASAAETIHAGRTPADRFGNIEQTCTPGLARYKQPESIYRRALRHYGDRNQIFKTAEEASELSAAIMRYMGASDIGLSSSPLLALVEELADVEIMCKQMRLVFGDQPIDAAKRQKLERLERRLEE